MPAVTATPGGLLVIDVELVELAPSDQCYDQAEDAARAALVSRRMRAAIVASGRYRVLDAVRPTAIRRIATWTARRAGHTIL